MFPGNIDKHSYPHPYSCSYHYPGVIVQSARVAACRCIKSAAEVLVLAPCRLPVESNAVVWEQVTPKRIRAQCASHSDGVDKLVCPDCFSILALEPVGGTITEANLGCIDDGDYSDAKVCESNFTMWPRSLFAISAQSESTHEVATCRHVAGRKSS